jgi:hypothetical protein
MSLGWIQSMTFHDMKSWLGFNKYDATQRSYYTNLLYQYFPAEKHTVDAGVSYRYDHYDELQATSRPLLGQTVTGLALRPLNQSRESSCSTLTLIQQR